MDRIREGIEHIDYMNVSIRFHEELSNILTQMKIPFYFIKGKIIVTGTNMIDMLGLLFTNPMGMMYGHKKIPNIKVWLDHQDALLPTKARESDVGYDLTIVKIHKYINENTIMYDTGVKIQVPWGHYVEVVPRSSLSKTGWILSNSIGIIDSSYTGNIYIAVTRMSDDTCLLPLPFKGFQFIIRKQYHANMILQTEDSVQSETNRGNGGFGSTSNRA